MEIDTLCKKCIDLPPIPGNSRIGFEQIAKACAKAIAVLAMEKGKTQATSPKPPPHNPERVN
jgi:hypothetical protein